MNELTAIAGAALVYTVLAMWATQPSSSCVMIEEPRRHLNLTRQVDREHLAQDAQRIHLLARRYARHLGNIAAGVNPEDPASSTDTEAARCQDHLAVGVATVHDVPIDVVHAAMVVEP